MFFSNNPSVFGLVKHQSGDIAVRAQFAQVIQIGKTFAVERIVFTEKPERCADAGLVP